MLRTAKSPDRANKRIEKFDLCLKYNQLRSKIWLEPPTSEICNWGTSDGRQRNLLVNLYPSAMSKILPSARKFWNASYAYFIRWYLPSENHILSWYQPRIQSLGGLEKIPHRHTTATYPSQDFPAHRDRHIIIQSPAMGGGSNCVWRMQESRQLLRREEQEDCKPLSARLIWAIMFISLLMYCRPTTSFLRGTQYPARGQAR